MAGASGNLAVAIFLSLTLSFNSAQGGGGGGGAGRAGGAGAVGRAGGWQEEQWAYLERWAQALQGLLQVALAEVQLFR